MVKGVHPLPAVLAADTQTAVMYPAMWVEAGMRNFHSLPPHP
jgi:hypothetical protein